MLDPLTALSLASSIVQLVDFSIGLVTDGVELYQKGRLSDNDELEQATRYLTQLTKALAFPQPFNVDQQGMPPENLSQSESNLRRLARDCRVLGAELIAKLEAVKADKPQNWLESFRKAVRNAKNKVKVQSLEQRLKTLQDQLNLHLLAVLSDKNSNVVLMLQKISADEVNVSSRIERKVEEIRRTIERQNSGKADRNELFKDVGSMCTDLAEETDRVARIQRVLGSLRFKLIRFRQSNIKHAHARTLEWIFSDSATNTRPRAPLLDWMKTQNGIFWIAGKAGSGKSTLMKFLCDHRATMESLQKWADGSKLCLASYFFWSAGAAMQKSQEGLLVVFMWG